VVQGALDVGGTLPRLVKGDAVDRGVSRLDGAPAPIRTVPAASSTVMVVPVAMVSEALMHDMLAPVELPLARQRRANAVP
jgi:hypothetical protein